MKPRNGALASLLFLATCTEAEPNPATSTNSVSPRLALGKVPASEVATWKKVGASVVPDERYLQAVAFDETRKVLVMFGGLAAPYGNSPTPRQDLWEWSPATGAWTDRTPTGTKPAIRSGAELVFDSTRNKFVMFGGRAGSGYNYQDTWEWDPTTGAWTDRTAAGTVPSSRCQGAMVFEKSTGKVLLFGGGRSTNGDTSGLSMAVSFADTWEWDAATGAWSQRTVTAGPSGRYDASMVWDSTRNRAVLFGGMEKDDATVDGIPKQDTWEWDPAAGTWSERTASGNKPSPRWGQAAAFDGSRGKLVVFGGWDVNTGGYLNDLWDWDPATAAWTQRLTGTEDNLPSQRIYASLVSNDSAGRLELVAGMINSTTYYGGTGGYYGGYGGSIGYPVPVPITFGPVSYSGIASKEVWELEPVAPAFTDRSAALNSPGRLTDHAMAYCPDTGKVYVFGGIDDMYVLHNDLWEWDGSKWSKVAADVQPTARMDAGLAYDPARKSLILFGGQNTYSSYTATVFNDTWEWSSTTRKWTQLFPTNSPEALYGHGMVTDTGRNKILLYGGMTQNTVMYGYPPSSYPGIYPEPLSNDVWEWDGAKSTWTNRTPPATTSSPAARQYPVIAYDEGRQKLFLLDNSNYSMYPGSTSSGSFWEWDPVSAGWVARTSGDYLDYNSSVYVAYDSIRRREVFCTDAVNPMVSSTAANETWELDAKGPTWYVRNLVTTPSSRYYAAMAYDRGRGVVVLYGGSANGFSTDETWEYSVVNLGNGTGCSTASASLCASGNCVEGVCCDSASCTGACQSCNVSGKEGSCVAATAGTEVAGSCSNGQACDGKGGCKTKNGTACTSATACASGFCADGVCCDGTCTGQCKSCNQAGHAGSCTPYAAGSDPEKECGYGSGACATTCDGVSSCAYPAYGSSCGGCSICDGMGTCFVSGYTPYCNTGGYYGNTGGYYGNTGGYYYGSSGGYYGNTGGYSGNAGGSGGGKGGTSGGYGTGGTHVTGGNFITGGTTYVTGGTTYVVSGGNTYLVGGGQGGAGGGYGGFASGGAGGTDTSLGTGGATHLRNSGCGCSLGAPGLGTAWTLPLALGAIAVFWRGRRRGRRQ
jgi:hypothetical protein